MPRPKRDGTPARPPSRRKLTDAFVQEAGKRGDRAHAVWETHQRGLCVVTQTTGFKSWKCVYSHRLGPRWYHIGAVAAIGLADARKIAAGIMLRAAMGEDPVGDRQAERSRGTFAELAEQYFDEYAKKRNKSWQQTDKLVRAYLLPRWGTMQAASISRSDAKALMRRVTSPSVANQSLKAASAIFAWAIREEVSGVTTNPCAGIEHNPTKSRERVLSDSELPQFWSAFDAAGFVESAALKAILLTGQRPGEVAHMRVEHIVDGWWQMPGDPVPALDWPGTKNGATHRVWLPAPVLGIIDDMDCSGGFVFAGPRGRAVDNLDAAMRNICKSLGCERATPHDLRRSHGTRVTAMGFGRDAMNRIQNHREGGIGSVYDRHGYAEENKKVMEAVATKIIALAEGVEASNVVALR